MGQYFDNENLVSEEKTIEVNIFERNFKFITDNGVFSKESLDKGTRVLLEALDINNLKEKVLDVGCGYGPITIILGKLNPQLNILGIDVNKRVLKLALKNKKLNQVNNVDFKESDVYQNITNKYDVIITNPPIRAGKQVVLKIVLEAINYLNEDGCLYVVISAHQGAKSLLKELERIYCVEKITKAKNFFVYKCQKIN